MKNCSEMIYNSNFDMFLDFEKLIVSKKIKKIKKSVVKFD